MKHGNNNFKVKFKMIGQLILCTATHLIPLKYRRIKLISSMRIQTERLGTSTTCFGCMSLNLLF